MLVNHQHRLIRYRLLRQRLNRQQGQDHDDRQKHR